MRIAVAGVLAVIGLVIVWLSFDDDYVASTKPNIILIRESGSGKARHAGCGGETYAAFWPCVRASLPPACLLA